jgi:glycosyltransferase involved in cell wall biosynthesis
MRIAVNTRLLVKDKLEGIGWFTYETLLRITKLHPEHEFIFFFDRKFEDEFVFSDNVTPVVLFPQARHPFLWFLFFECSITAALKKYKADLFLSTDGWVSLRTKVKTISVIHDLNFEHFPQYIKFLPHLYYDIFFKHYARKAARIATVSEYTRQDICTLYGIDAEHIDIVYNGSNEIYKPLSDSEQLKVRQQFTNGMPYFIFIGLIHKRKNLINLFKAYDLFRKFSENGIKLMIVGSKKWWKGDIEDSYKQMSFKEDVIFTGRLEPIDLSRALASSLALTYVSFFEGFGIPIIEAFNAETAVITSNITSMPEVARDAALLVDPYSAESIAQAMQKIATDKELRQSLIEKGKKRRLDFSWDATAGKLWDTISKELK